ncbi:HEAT repeat domain-containing protein [bacterium]|nr:HEAT repeat domain-containing protein [bacterium]
MDKVFSLEIIEYVEKNLLASNGDYVAFFKQLKANFRSGEIAKIYNYILENKTDIKLLTQVIREINSSKFITNFDSLLTFIKNTKNVDLKVLAIKTICVFKNTKAVPVLLECLKNPDSNYKIRLACADSLGKIGDKNAFDVLGYIATNEEEKSAYVKESAVIALGNLGDSRAIDVFSSIMSGKQMFLDKFSYLKERVIEAISKLDTSKDARALQIIKNSLMEPSSRIRISAIEALMNMDSKESYELIYDRLKFDDDIEVKKNALVALYNISDRTILDEVIQNDFDKEIKMYAQELIDEYEDGNEE